MHTLLANLRLVQLAYAIWFVVVGADASYAAYLDGETLVARRVYRETPFDDPITVNSSPFVVGPGVELPNFGDQPSAGLDPLISIDISNKQILITLLVDQQPADVDGFVFTVLPAITSLSVNSATNWTGFNTGRLSASSDTVVSVSLGQLSGLQGQQIVLDVIPEPATAGLALIAVAAWAARRRRMHR